MFQAETRLAARRQARAEAREIRMRELERQQCEAEVQGEKHSIEPAPSEPIRSIRTPISNKDSSVSDVYFISFH